MKNNLIDIHFFLFLSEKTETGLFLLLLQFFDENNSSDSSVYLVVTECYIKMEIALNLIRWKSKKHQPCYLYWALKKVILTLTKNQKSY